MKGYSIDRKPMASLKWVLSPFPAPIIPHAVWGIILLPASRSKLLLRIGPVKPDLARFEFEPGPEFAGQPGSQGNHGEGITRAFEEACEELHERPGDPDGEPLPPAFSQVGLGIG